MKNDEIKPSENFEIRLIKEHKELSEKFRKLEQFLVSKKFSELSDLEKQLLHEQVGHMKGYRGVLSERIAYYAGEGIKG